MLKAVEHGSGLLNVVGEKQLRNEIVLKNNTRKKICAETLAGAVFQRNVKNKS
jgi:hypothetical protein